LINLHVHRYYYLWQVSKFVDTALQEAGVNVERDLDQVQFVDVYRKVVLALVQFLREKPLSVVHTEKVFDGSSISQLIKDKQALNLVCDKSPSTHENFLNFSFPATFYIATS